MTDLYDTLRGKENGIYIREYFVSGKSGYAKKAGIWEKTTYPGLFELEEKLNERLGIRFNENQLIIDGKTIAVIRYNGTGTRSFASITEKAADDDSIIIAISKKEDGLFNLWYETYTNIGANSKKKLEC